MNIEDVQRTELDGEYFLSLYKFRVAGMENPELHSDGINTNSAFLNFIAEYKEALLKIEEIHPIKVQIILIKVHGGNFKQLIGADGVFISLINGWK